MQEKLNIAVFVDYDNIEIGLKSTLRREFDVSLALDALKERGPRVTTPTRHRQQPSTGPRPSSKKPNRVQQLTGQGGVAPLSRSDGGWRRYCGPGR